MGIARYLCAAASCLCLLGCDKAKDDGATFMRQLEYEKKVDRLERQVADLESSLERTSNVVKAQSNYIDAIADQSDRIADVVSKNARINNENAANDMTLRGACGTEFIKLENGTYREKNKGCTVKDLKAG